MNSTHVTASFPHKTPHFSVLLGLVLILALVFRLATYNGMFGSDDLVYYGRSAMLANGDWASANYNGALRYGFNLPAAGFIALFGESPFVANLWPLLCSLIEVGAIFFFANAVMNRRAALFASLLLATVPLHMAASTRIHSDPVVSMFLTVSFVLLYYGLQRNRSILLMCAGLSIGGIFWAKELAAVTWLAFLPLLWFVRGRWLSLVPVIAGVIIMMLLHFVLMMAIAGDPLHLIKVVLGAMTRNFIDAAQGEDAVTYYLRYMFIDLRHVGLIAYLAIASLWLVPRWLSDHVQSKTGFYFALLWWLGLIAVLSVFPVSLSPLRFTMKQSNYITLFLAPTAVLAGMALAALPVIPARLIFAACTLLGLFLGAMQQADNRSFTANSRAVSEFAIDHPSALIVGSVNNSYLATFWLKIDHPNAPHPDILTFEATGDYKVPENTTEIFAVLDRQTMNWGNTKVHVTAPLPCWEFLQELKPAGLGLGNKIAGLISSALTAIPQASHAFEKITRPQRADVFRVNGLDPLCRASQIDKAPVH